MQLIKQLNKINELPPQLSTLQEHVDGKRRKLSSLLGEKYEVPKNELREELSNYGLNYALFTKLPAYREESTEALERRMQNKLYNQVKLNRLMSRYDEVQEAVVKQLHTVLLSREIRGPLHFFDEIVTGFGFQTHMRVHLGFIFWLRHSEILHRSLLTAAELELENRISSDKNATLRRLAADFLPGADLTDPKTCYVKALSRAQSVYEKADELPESTNHITQLPGTPAIQENKGFNENNQINTVLGLPAGQGTQLNEYQVKYQKVNEELINPEVRQAKSADAAFTIVNFINFGAKSFSVEVAKENATALFKQFNQGDIEASFDVLHEQIAFKLITDFVAIKKAEQLIEILVEEQIQKILYQPVLNTHFFKNDTKLDLLAFLSINSSENDEYRVKIINGASVLKESQDRGEKQDQQLRNFVFGAVFSLSRHRVLETVSKTLEGLFGEDYTGLCRALLSTVKIKELDYLIRRAFNLSLFYIYQTFFCIFHFSSKQHFPYVVQEYAVASETGEKAINYKVVDKQNNAVLFSHVDNEMQYFYAFLYQQFLNEINDRDISQEDLFDRGQEIILTQYQREYERLQTVVEILKNFQLIFLSSEKFHFSICALMCSIFRFRSEDQAYFLFQLQEFIMEAMKAIGDDVKSRIKAIKFTTITDLYQQNIKIDNQALIQMLLQMFHTGKQQYMHISTGNVKFVPYPTFLASVLESARVELLYITKQRQRDEDVQMKLQRAVLCLGDVAMNGFATGNIDLPLKLVYLLNVLSIHVCAINALIQAVGNAQSALGLQEDTFIKTSGLFTPESPFFDEFRKQFMAMQAAAESRRGAQGDSFNLGTSFESSVHESSATGGFRALGATSITGQELSAAQLQYSDSKTYFYDDDGGQINFTQLLCFKEFGGPSFLQTCDFFEKNIGTNSAFSWLFAVSAIVGSSGSDENAGKIVQSIIQYLSLCINFIQQKLFYIQNTALLPAQLIEIEAARDIYRNSFANPSELVKDRIMTIITDNLPPSSSGLIRQTFLTQNALSGSQTGQNQVPAIILRLIKLFSIVILLRAEPEYLEIRAQNMESLKKILQFPQDAQFIGKPDLLSQLLNSKNFYFKIDTNSPELIYIIQNHSKELLNMESIGERTLDSDEQQQLHQIYQILKSFKQATKIYYLFNQLANVLQLNQQFLKQYENQLNYDKFDEFIPILVKLKALLSSGQDYEFLNENYLFTTNDEKLFFNELEEQIKYQGDSDFQLTNVNQDCQNIIDTLQDHIGQSKVDVPKEYYLEQSKINVDTTNMLEKNLKIQQKVYNFLQLAPAHLKRIQFLPFMKTKEILKQLFYINMQLYNIFYLGSEIDKCGKVMVDGIQDLRIFVDEQLFQVGESVDNDAQQQYTENILQQQQQLHKRISNNLKQFQKELKIISTLKSKKEILKVKFEHVIFAFNSDLTSICNALQTNQLISFKDKVSTDCLSLTPLVSMLFNSFILRLLSLLTSFSQIKVFQEFNIANNQQVLFVNKQKHIALNAKKMNQISDSDLISHLQAKNCALQSINMEFLTDHFVFHIPETVKSIDFHDTLTQTNKEFVDFYTQFLYSQEKQLIPISEQKCKQLMQMIANSQILDDKKIQNNLQFNYFTQRKFLLNNPSLMKLLETRSPDITEIFIAHQTHNNLDQILHETMCAQPAPVPFTDICPSHLVPLYSEVYQLFNSEEQFEDADIQLYQFHKFVPGQAGISTVEEQIKVQAELEKEGNLDFLQSKAFKTFYINLVRSSFRHKQSKSFLYVSNFQLFKLYSEFLSDIYSEVQNQANIQQIVAQLNNYVTSQIQIKKMQVLQENQKCNMQKQSANAASNYLSKKFLNDYKSFSKEQETDIQHLSSYSQYQLKILSILVSKIYSKGLQVMLMHQSISEQYLDQLKFQYFQTSNQVIFDQNIKNLSNLFEKTQLPLFNELIHLENELYNYESLLKINALLLNREMNFQHIRINELEYQLQNYKDIQDSELSRLVILKNNLQNVNNEKQAVLRKQLTTLQVHLQQLSKEEDTLKDEIKAVIKPQKKENGISQAMKKQLQPLESLIDQQTNYQKMCVDLDQVQKQIGKVDEELVKYAESAKQLHDDVERQLLQYQSVNEQLIQQLKELKRARQEEVARVNELQRSITQKNAAQFEDDAIIEERARKAIAAVQNCVYRQRAQLSRRQEYLRKLQKLIAIYKQEEEKMIGFDGL